MTRGAPVRGYRRGQRGLGRGGTPSQDRGVTPVQISPVCRRSPPSRYSCPEPSSAHSTRDWCRSECRVSKPGPRCPVTTLPPYRVTITPPAPVVPTDQNHPRQSAYHTNHCSESTTGGVSHHTTPAITPSLRTGTGYSYTPEVGWTGVLSFTVNVSCQKGDHCRPLCRHPSTVPVRGGRILLTHLSLVSPTGVKFVLCSGPRKEWVGWVPPRRPGGRDPTVEGPSVVYRDPVPQTVSSGGPTPLPQTPGYLDSDPPACTGRQ